jgi:hypothetical protein
MPHVGRLPDAGAGLVSRLLQPPPMCAFALGQAFGLGLACFVYHHYQLLSLLMNLEAMPPVQRVGEESQPVIRSTWLTSSTNERYGPSERVRLWH